ncbi:MAG: M14 family zinc carboxypeptidase [Terriglobia bacterium]
MLSTQGRFLVWSAEEERYWFLSARDGIDRFRRLAAGHEDKCSFQEIARSATGLPVHAFRLGSGPKKIALISGMHGCEPSGPRGLLSYLDALINGTRPFGFEVDPEKTLEGVTLCVIPLMNPGGAERFSWHYPGCWHGTWLRRWDAAEQMKFFAEANEPEHFLYGSYVKKAPMRFTPDQIARWESTGNVIGSSLTDAGLDMWFDWDESYGPETRGTKALFEAVKPQTIVDFHNFMYPTEVFAPTVYSRGAPAAEERALAEGIQQAWRHRSILFHDRPPRPYPKPAEKYYEDYWFHGLGARCLIIEENGGELSTAGAEYEPTPGARPLTRRESLATVFVAADAIVNHIIDDA